MWDLGLSKKEKTEQAEAETVDVLARKTTIIVAQAEAHKVNVLAHIAAHREAGQTAAVKAHMAAPAHKAIVDAAAKEKGSGDGDTGRVDTNTGTTEKNG